MQEDRFRLLTEAGQVYLLTLGKNAHLNGHTLDDLRLQHLLVAVSFQGEPNLVGGVATDVREGVR